MISALTAFAAPGDGVLLHSPTYIGFTRSIENNGYRIVHSPLTLDERGVWRMDYEDMDRKLKEHHIHVAVFCSPPQSFAGACGNVGNREGHGSVQRPTIAWSFPTRFGPI